MPKTFGDDIIAVFRALVMQRKGPTAIHNHLVDQFGAHAPSLSTVKGWYKEEGEVDQGERWRIEDMEPEDAARVLAIQAAVILDTEGRIQHFSMGIADWIARLSRIAPDLSGMWLYAIAWEYMRRQLSDQPTTDLDAYLSFTPWRGSECSNPYWRAVKDGWVPRPPAIFMFHDVERLGRALGLAFNDLISMSPDERAAIRRAGENEATNG